MRKSIAIFLAPAIAVLLLSAPLGSLAHGQGINQSNTDLPPLGVYASPSDVFAQYSGPGLAIVLSDVRLQAFPGATRLPVNGGVDEVEMFSSSLTGLASINGGPAQPIAGTGPEEWLTQGHGPAGSQTGTFQTEMLSLDLTVGGGLMIRESPTLPSLGQTSIAPIGGGMFHVNSFFDVFTELSLDGGATWMPSNGSSHVNLVPEPSSVVLFGLGALACVGSMVRRRKNRI